MSTELWALAALLRFSLALMSALFAITLLTPGLMPRLMRRARRRRQHLVASLYPGQGQGVPLEWR